MSPAAFLCPCFPPLRLVRQHCRGSHVPAALGHLWPGTSRQPSAGLLGCGVPSRPILAPRDFLLPVNVHAFKTNMLHCIFCFGLGWAIVLLELFLVFLNSTAILLGNKRFIPTPKAGVGARGSSSAAAVPHCRCRRARHRPSVKGTKRLAGPLRLRVPDPEPAGKLSEEIRAKQRPCLCPGCFHFPEALAALAGGWLCRDSAQHLLAPGELQKCSQARFHALRGWGNGAAVPALCLTAPRRKK